MRKILTALAFGLAAQAAMADPVMGTWQTQPGDDGNFAHVTIGRCGETICGTLAKAFSPDGKPRASDNIGRAIIWDMKPQGEGKYRGGKIWAPDRDKTYNSRMELKGNALEVSGCILGICRGQTWRRVE